ncbi:hypothetical protein R1sor_005813 [Riccia sorocarpa]|uniref:Reverse transcriptase zinc-binding domain-containing protein n=1 Tax=Riccia sorocarpa TaxID=122646 RepID=A0ABD3HKW9_9MARC
MTFLLTAWAKMTSLVNSPGPTDISTWRNTPIWGPPLQGIRHKALTGKSRGHKLLRDQGLTHLKHIADEHGKIKERSAISQSLMQNRTAKAAFDKIKQGTTAFQDSTRVNASKLLYFEGTGITNDRWVISTLKASNHQNTPGDQSDIQVSYRTDEHGQLTKLEAAITLSDYSWTTAMVIPTSRKKNGERALVLAEKNSIEETLAKWKWSNGKDFFYPSNRFIRQSLGPNMNAATKKLQKWKRFTPFKENDARRWGKLWNPLRPVQQTSFLWMLLYSAIAVNRWRFPAAARADPQTWCTKYDKSRTEDVLHFIWTCPSSKHIWEWVFSILHTAFPRLNGWKPKMAHVIAVTWEEMRKFTETQWLDYKVTQRKKAGDTSQADIDKTDKHFCEKWAVRTLDFRLIGAVIAGSLRPP